MDEAIEMYQEMHMWDEAIEVAEAKVGHSFLCCVGGCGGGGGGGGYVLVVRGMGSSLPVEELRVVDSVSTKISCEKKIPVK